MRNTLIITFIILTLFIIISFIKILLFQEQNSSFTNLDIITYLKKLRKGVLISSTATITVQQKIMSIDKKNGLIPKTNISYIYRLEVDLENHNRAYVYFTKKELQNTSIFLPNGPNYIKSTISKLKSGDTILFERVYKYNLDGELPVEILSGKITVINR